MMKKLCSRKLWMAIAGVATGISMVLGVEGTEISTVAGGVVAVLSCITYIVTEGKIDAEGVKNAVLGAQAVVDTVQGGDDGESKD